MYKLFIGSTRCEWFFNEHRNLFTINFTGIIDNEETVIYSENIKLVGFGFNINLGGCGYSTNYASVQEIDKTFTLPKNAKDIELKIFDADPFIKDRLGIPKFIAQNSFIEIKITGNY